MLVPTEVNGKERICNGCGKKTSHLNVRKEET